MHVQDWRCPQKNAQAMRCDGVFIAVVRTGFAPVTLYYKYIIFPVFVHTLFPQKKCTFFRSGAAAPICRPHFFVFRCIIAFPGIYQVWFAFQEKPLFRRTA
jgi:hypothetical protein